ncbi:MAG: hypothetical protein PHC95_11915 [Parabacteroides sp.]|nr:hypothetical protein [Parabacteroides sp.]
MDTYKHFEYSEWLARHLAPIGHTDANCHFLRSDEIEEISDLEERISSISGYVLVAIDGHNSDLSWKNDDNLVDIPQYFIAILKQGETGNIDALHAAKAECKDLLMQVVCRMMLDWNEERNGLHCLEADSMTMRGVGPIGENFYGVMLGFNLQKPVSFFIDKSIWV